MIDQDNLKKNESVGTFRWNDSTKLIDVPRKEYYISVYLVAFKSEHR